MKTKLRIRVPDTYAPDLTPDKEKLLNQIKDSFSMLGISSRYYVDNTQHSLPIYIELNVPGNNDGSIELLKLKKYIF